MPPGATLALRFEGEEAVGDEIPYRPNIFEGEA
jgi:hypothetical protein